MTLVAGIFSRSARLEIPDETCNTLSRVISRDLNDSPSVFRDKRLFVVKADIGAFGEPAWVTGPDGSVTAVTGEPLLESVSGAHNRALETALLHQSHSESRWNALASARGVFTAMSYYPSPARIAIATDRLGLRPMFVWLGDEHIAFASQLRILESVDIVPKEMDVRGVAELSAIGFPLADRTPYTNIFLLKAGEVLFATDDRISRSRYWRWDQIEPSQADVASLAVLANERFKSAVALRLRGDRTTASYLSGGLDSRAVVTALRKAGANLHTFNFSLSGTLDEVIGGEFARRIGTTHHQGITVSEEPEWSAMMSAKWSEVWRSLDSKPERPGLVWSGDGGSVSLGYVYMTQELVALLRSGNPEAAIALFLRRQGSNVPYRFLRAPVAQQLRRVLQRGIEEELADIESEDRGRAFHLFLMMNDQRRHLATHFSTIDLHRLEFQLPFFDSAFLETVLSVPIDLSLGHGFYMRWLEHFGEDVTSVPWQAYSGHVPCPLPMPATGAYQWGSRHRDRIRAARKRQWLGRARTVLAAEDFPHALMNRRYLRIASLMYALGLRDYRGVMRTAHHFHNYWSASAGRYRLPDAARISV
ncbi:MAG: hypothetical protein H7Z74_10305 [Anaerolineae bacterium]|nr:hypothetical protein [Gemmatimonadaceae bacterium]